MIHIYLYAFNCIFFINATVFKFDHMTIKMLLYALTFTNLLHIDIETGARTIYTKFPLIRAGPQIKASLFSIIDTNIKISAALK